MKDESYPAVYAYSYPAYLTLAEAKGLDPMIKIGRTERGSVQRVASQQRLTGSLEKPVILRVWAQPLGKTAEAESLMHAVLDAFDRRHAGAASGSEVFRVNLATLDALAAAFGWVDSPDAARRSGAPGAEGPSKDAWRTGRNKAVKRWGFSYPQCAREGCGATIDTQSPRGADGKFVYCSSDCAEADDRSRAARADVGGSAPQRGESGTNTPARDAWRTGRNEAAAGWGFTYPQCARAKCGRAIDETSPRGSDGRFRYCSSSCADLDDRARGIRGATDRADSN
jgi:T5orf172 domain-containing protein